MNAQDAPAIRTAGLGKRYGSLRALQDCSASVPRGREDHAAEDPRRAERPQRGRGGGAGTGARA